MAFKTPLVLNTSTGDQEVLQSSDLISSNLIGIAGGAINRVLFENASNVISENAKFRYTTASLLFELGSTYHATNPFFEVDGTNTTITIGDNNTGNGNWILLDDAIGNDKIDINAGNLNLLAGNILMSPLALGNYSVAIANSLGVISGVLTGISGTVLTSTGVATAPTWQTPSTLAGTVTVVDAASDTSTWVLLGGSATGNLPVLSDSRLIYNSSTNTLGTENIDVLGSTSGAVTLKSAAIVTSYDMLLPSAAPAAGTVLYSGVGGSSALTWTSPSTFSVNTAANLTFTSSYIGYGSGGILTGNALFTYKNTSSSEFIAGFTTYGVGLEIKCNTLLRDYKFGNVSGGTGNLSTLYINDVSQNLSYSTVSGTFLNLDKATSVYEIGDCFAFGLGTKVSVDDNTSVITLTAGAVILNSLAGSSSQLLQTDNTGVISRAGFVSNSYLLQSIATVDSYQCATINRKYIIQSTKKLVINITGILRIL